MSQSHSTDQPILYEDKLVRLTSSTIRFRWYYFPFGDKTVQLDLIDRIEDHPANLTTGSFRIWGTGNFSTWFPLDWKRPGRSRFFHLYEVYSNGYIGFTVVDEKAFLEAVTPLGVKIQHL